ncbi:MAG: in-like serine protease [Nitrobacter vulgaris]|nr:in-like serine protease [Nitrobacter vulgaris]
MSQDRQGQRKRDGSNGTAPDSEKKPSFTPDVLDSTVIALPLLEDLKKRGGIRKVHDVIIDLNLEYPGGRDMAQRRVCELIGELVKDHRGEQGVKPAKTRLTKQYVFGRLSGSSIRRLVRLAQAQAPIAHGDHFDRSIPALYRIWPDFKISRLTTKSVATVKADAARNAFAAFGEEIVWAIMDSGIDNKHRHFQMHQNLTLPAPLRHCDFTVLESLDEERDGDDERSTRDALTDEAGHGTHVAGIIAGELESGRNEKDEQVEIVATIIKKDERGGDQPEQRSLKCIAGMAPRCKLLSLKVLDKGGRGPVSNLIAACEQIQEINGNGRHIRVQGVNMSVGYDFEPKWFACGQSPLCVEVDRLVRSGVVVVVAAGNTGYGWNQSAFRGAVAAGMDLTINDPGNAELAITVGSTHREMPHVYGISYFSSKGPTGDGRLKPDLVAPGEKIISCHSTDRPDPHADIAAGRSVGAASADPAHNGRNVAVARYREDSGTSMAAPHVSGVIAAFLSIRREFIGRPDRVKEIFLSTATDLRRDRYFQGCGLVDLMRAVQSV